MVETLLNFGCIDGSWILNKSLILKLKTILDLPVLHHGLGGNSRTNALINKRYAMLFSMFVWS